MINKAYHIDVFIKYPLLLLLGCLFSFTVVSQKEKLTLEVVYDIQAKWLNRIDFKKHPRDKIELNTELNAIIIKLQKKSYFSASVDSLWEKNEKRIAHIHVGKRLNWARLAKGNIEEEILSKTGYRDKIYNQKRFKDRQFGRFIESILQYYENNGYPFVSLQLDSIDYVEKKGIEATLKLTKYKYVEVDTIEVYGDYLVSEKFLYNYLAIKPHKPYNESNISSITKRIQDLSFIGEQSPPKVIFTEDHTALQLFLNKKRASRFDGVIGLLQEEETGIVQFTGDVELSLTNAFKRGELIGLNWRGLPNNTQDLRINFNFPYLFNTPFGIDLAFQLYKRDTTFLDIISEFGIQYFMNSTDYLKVIYENHSSNLLSTSSYEGGNVLPPELDFTTNYYGAEINLNKLDYSLNPTKGFKITLNAKAGFKEIKINGNLEDSLYNEVDLNQVVFKGQFYGGYYFSIVPRHVIYLGNQSAYINNPQILRNELFRIGGLKTLRGFDEESIFVSLYSIGTLEYRFILDKNSNLNLFGDFAYTEQKLYNSEVIIDTPYGFGVGTTFQTNAGLFSLSYAVGSRRDNPVDFRAAKIHFGFLNYF